MSSRSKKIMDLLNYKTTPLAATHDNENQVPTPNYLYGQADCSNSRTYESLSDHNKLTMDLASVQSAPVNVVLLSDISNNQENQRYYNVNAFFETEALAHENHVSRKRKNVEYNISPVHSNESDADLSDKDPTYDIRNKTAKTVPALLRRSSSSSSSSSSISSSSSSSSASSSTSSNSNSSPSPTPISVSEPENSTTAHIYCNTYTTTTTEAFTLPDRNQIKDSQMRNIEEEKEICQKRGRKRASDPKKWRQNVNKTLRNTGHSYKSAIKKTVPARQIKQPCTEKCRLKCSEKFTIVERQAIFDSYWNIGDIEQQRSFILSCMTDINPKYKYTNAVRPRQCNKAFHFNLNGKPIRVCKHFFIVTLDISDRVIRTVKQKTDHLGILEKDQRGRHNNHPITDISLISDIKTFVDSIPRVESHYTRQTSSREYIDGGKSITDLFKDFKARQEQSNKPFGRYCTFYNVFTKQYNISFFCPRKDQCDLCMQYANSNVEQKNLLCEKYESHLEEKKLSRQEKYNDRCKINDMCKVLVFDLQAVLQSPRGNTSAFYYKSKLNSYNFTVTLLNKKVDGKIKDAYTDVHSYFWNETDGKRGANEIGSCLMDCFERLCSESRHSDGEGLNLTLYSDNCAGQNKNKYIVALYLYAVTKLNIDSITHKFLIKGHTQNEADNIHSLIEKEIKKNLKSGPIYCPHQYVAIIKNAKKTGQKFFVHELTYGSFLDLKKLQEDFGYNFNETEDKNYLLWNDIKMLKVEKSEPFSFYVKTSYKDEQFTKICIRNKRRKMKSLTELTGTVKAYSGKQTLSENKKKDLKELIDKNLIPNFYKDFYDTIL